VFDRIAKRIERSGGANFYEQAELTQTRQKVVKSAVVMANELKADAILVFTRHGSMARYAGWLRPHHSTVYGVCARDAVARGLTLSWGVTPIVIPFDMINPQNTIESALKHMIENGFLKKGQTVVAIGSILSGDQIIDAVQMRVVG
jgi:pyruvate kinase